MDVRAWVAMNKALVDATNEKTLLLLLVGTPAPEVSDGGGGAFGFGGQMPVDVVGQPRVRRVISYGCESISGRTIVRRTRRIDDAEEQDVEVLLLIFALLG